MNRSSIHGQLEHEVKAISEMDKFEIKQKDIVLSRRFFEDGLKMVISLWLNENWGKTCFFVVLRDFNWVLFILYLLNKFKTFQSAQYLENSNSRSQKFLTLIFSSKI